MGVHANSTYVWRQRHAPKVDTSQAIHRYHAYGIVQGSLLHAYAAPKIFNWVWHSQHHVRQIFGEPSTALLINWATLDLE